jgi:enterochelin esterase-like enzyme
VIAYYASKTLGDVRDVYVYTPPGYDEDPDRMYSVLYLLHGGGDNAGGWSSVGRAHLIMDNLLAEGKARPMIIVMPLGQAVPRSASFEDLRTRNTPLFEKDLFADIMPHLGGVAIGAVPRVLASAMAVACDRKTSFAATERSRAFITHLPSSHS